MVNRGKLLVSSALVLALGVAAIAYADGASENDAYVEGSVKPKKLDAKKYKPIQLFTEVGITPGRVPTCGGGAAKCNPESELIEYDRDGRWKTSESPTCSAAIEFQPTEAALAACPEGSAIGSGEADIMLGDVAYEGITVTAFNGPGRNEIRLHTYDPRLAGATPTVFGKIVKAPSGKPFGIALLVADAPDVAGDVGVITRFNATIDRSAGVALARCKDKNFLIQRTVTYDDGSQDVAMDSQRCKRKGGR